VADVNGEIEEKLLWILRKVGFNLSPGNPRRLVFQAEHLRYFAASIRETYEQLSQDMSRLGNHWSGDAATSQARSWATHVALADHIADTAESMARSLDEHVEKSTRIIKTILGVALELLELYVICVALSWVTGYLSDLLFVSRVGEFIGRLCSLFSKLGELIKSTAEAMAKWGSLSGKIGEYSRVLLTEYVPDGLKEYPINLAATVVPAKLGGRDLKLQDLLLAMIPGIAQYGALNLGMEILEKESRLVARVKNAIEGKGNGITDLEGARPSSSDLPSPPVVSLAEDGAVSPATTGLRDRDFNLNRDTENGGNAGRESRSAVESAENPGAPQWPLPEQYRLAVPKRQRSLAELLFEDVALPVDVRSALEREFHITRAEENRASSVISTGLDSTSKGEAFMPKTNRELAYAFMKETLVNGVNGALVGIENGQPDHFLTNAAISAPLSGLRKVALERYFKPMAYRGMPTEATLDQRIIPEAIVRTMAYALRNSAREAIEDAAKGDDVTTQLTHD
jgi:hypothetical protein